MTSRLKRKLGDIGVDTSSTKANENFCLIGTPLPPLEKSRDTGEFVPLWKQDVRDEKGRRRLHGAFTGGFSAGYFNTVGSKEGWTPQTFVSSRSDRAMKKAAKPEDFMDEEDIQDLADSRKIIDTTDEMDLTSGTQAEKPDDDQADPLTAALQSAMLPPTRDSSGARILKKMGWRVGQGIGPRVTLKQRRLQDLQARGATGGLPSSSTDVDVDMSIDDDSEEANKHTYAPRDTPILIMERKDNSHGLGYRPGMGLNESVGGKGRSSGPKISAGFGLGALNDADEDDLDVYDGSSSTLRNRLAYDASDDADGERVTLGSRSKSNLGATSGPRVTASGGTSFRDGTAVLPEFALSGRPVMEDRWYPLPDIPPGWKPDPKRVWSQDASASKSNNKENVEQEGFATGPMPHNKWKTSVLSADERGSILGETPLPSAPRSVFDFISQKDRERLKNIAASLQSSSTDTSANASETPTSTSNTTPTPRIPRTEPQIARAALTGFQPFATDPVKQARYTAYLQSQAQANTTDPDSTTLMLKPLPHQSIAEFNSEMEEYAQSAIVFKPMSGAMAGRFTRASNVVIEQAQVIEGLHQPVFKDAPSKKTTTGSSGAGITFVDSDGAEAKDKETKGKDVEERELSPKENAARLEMYGHLTRETKAWQPARLLCKRFGVKDPSAEVKNEQDISSSHPSTAVAAAPSLSSAAASSFAAATFDPSSASGADLEKFGISMDGVGTGFSLDAGGSGGPRDLTNIGLGDDDETQGRDTLTYERPSVDVFKAIFASDDEDSDDDEEGGGEAEKGDGGEGGSIAGPSSSVPTMSSLVPDVKGAAGAPFFAPSAPSTEPIDLNTFKPTFVRREKEKDIGTSNSEKKERKEKKEKKKDKDKRKAIVSFMDDEAEGGDSLNVVVEKPKKKKRKKDKDKNGDMEGRKKEEDGDMDMWVEKPAPTGVDAGGGIEASVQSTHSLRPLDADGQVEIGPVPHSAVTSQGGGGEAGVSSLEVSRGRKRAIDFM